MEDDDLAYLSPDFDLNSLTVPKLRSILVSHDVTYQSSAKKPQLIEILQREVLPKSKNLLSSRARIKRTSKGIEDMSSQDGTVDGEDEKLMPPPPVPKTPRGRKKKSSTGLDTSEDDTAQTPATTRKTKTPGRRSKSVRASDTETDTNTDAVRPSARKPRKSGVARTPARESHVKIEEPATEIKTEPTFESPFSDENPFQSGSSPSTDTRRVSSEGKRKSLGASTSKDPERKKSSSKRRETTSPPSIKQDGEVSSRGKSTFEIPVSQLQNNDVEPSEEFTPEEQLELVRDRAAEGYSGKDLLPPRRRKKRPASTASKYAPWVVMTLLLSGFGGWWRKEKIEIGYCGAGKDRWSLANTQVPEWANVLEPQCEPCPLHAYCSRDLETQCESGYILSQHPYSLFGVLPLPPTCEPDGELARKVKSVADKAVEVLRERRAQYECRDLPDHEPVEISEEELKKDIKAKKTKKMSDEDFDDLWNPVVEDILAREEVISDSDGQSSTPGRKLTSTSLARLGYSCAIQRRFWLTLSVYRFHILLVVPAVALLFYIRRSIRAHRDATAQIPSLVSLTLDRLATQAALKARGDADDGWISIGQLRDDVLREVLKISERERVWKRVRAVVESNANVRAATRESASGEWARVWEWIGPVGRRPVDATGARSRRLSETPVEGGSSPAVQSEMREERNWNEGRPIY